MPRINDASNRALVKGVKIFAADPLVDTAFRRLFGLKSVNSVNAERAGEVDATELWQGPDALDEENEEQFFFTQQYGGTKKIQPIELTVNKVPKMLLDAEAEVLTNQISMLTLLDWYTHDKIIQWSMRTRTGYEYAFNAMVDKVNQTGEEGNLWNGTISLIPQSWFIYRPLPTAYVPGGNTNPIYGPPGVSNTVIAWSATLPAVRYNASGDTQGGGGA